MFVANNSVVIISGCAIQTQFNFTAFVGYSGFLANTSNSTLQTTNSQIQGYVNASAYTNTTVIGFVGWLSNATLTMQGVTVSFSLSSSSDSQTTGVVAYTSNVQQTYQNMTISITQSGGKLNTGFLSSVVTSTTSVQNATHSGSITTPVGGAQSYGQLCSQLYYGSLSVNSYTLT